MEQWDESFFSDALRLEKLYRSCMRQAAHDHRLSPNEVAVLLFLSRNAPQQDTSTDIAAVHGISKALVARSVDRLQKRGLIAGERDADDRRLIHLRLCGEGEAIAAQMRQDCRRIAAQLHAGISEEELHAAHRIMRKMQRNLDALLEDMERQVK